VSSLVHIRAPWVPESALPS